MILSKEVEINITTRNITFYKNRGYVNISLGDCLLIKIEDLNTGSPIKIDVICDNCDTKKTIQYRLYINNLKIGNLYYCNKCKHIKSKQTKLERYGNENYNNQKKHEQTCLIKYGVKHYSKNDDVKKRIKQTKLERYGDENYNNLKKCKQTKLERYGNENYNNSLKQKRIIDEKTFKNITDLKKINQDSFEIFCLKCEQNYLIDKKCYFDRKQYKRITCTKCNPINTLNSSSELEVLYFIEENYKNKILTNKRNIITPHELDIYLPELKIAFEFNGLYWHSEIHKNDKNYHLNKTKKCNEQNIKLFHIYEDDWNNKQEIIKSMILNKLKLTKNKIYARNTKIKQIKTNKIVNKFYLENHLQGKSTYSLNFGLYHNNILVSLMSFKRNKKNYELIRFANKLNFNIIGGASKLFNNFVEKYNFDEIKTFSNNDYSNGELYNILSFEKSTILKPDYSYIINYERKHKFNFRKKSLENMGYNIKNKSEHEICLENGIYRIYDSGKIKWIYTKK